MSTVTAGRLPEAGVRPPGFPRLLVGPATDEAEPLRSHLDRLGPLPLRGADGPSLVAAVEASGLRGRGGGGFPTGAKLRAVAERRGPAVVVANGTEGEAASRKDRTLLRTRPHLVVDGAVAAARAVGADEVVLAVGRADRAGRDALERALAERARAGADPVAIVVATPPDRFVAGEETALVRWLNGGPAKPTGIPPRPSEKGVRGRPTLVQNVETLANVALVARFGPEWFRSVGTAAEPGSALVTVGGAVARPGVYEVALGTSLAKLVDAAGGATEPLQALLVGGWFGSWLPAAAADVPLLDSALREHGAALGARAIVALPRTACGLVEAARVASYLAEETAGQCGPCRFGLPAIAGVLHDLATGRAAPGAAGQARAWCAEVTGRGACRHPDGATRFVESSLRMFADEIELHARGRCSGRIRAALLPVPAEREGGWR